MYVVPVSSRRGTLKDMKSSLVSIVCEKWKVKLWTKERKIEGFCGEKRKRRKLEKEDLRDRHSKRWRASLQTNSPRTTVICNFCEWATHAFIVSGFALALLALQRGYGNKCLQDNWETNLGSFIFVTQNYVLPSRCTSPGVCEIGSKIRSLFRQWSPRSKDASNSSNINWIIFSIETAQGAPEHSLYSRPKCGRFLFISLLRLYNDDVDDSACIRKNRGHRVNYSFLHLCHLRRQKPSVFYCWFARWIRVSPAVTTGLRREKPATGIHPTVAFTPLWAITAPILPIFFTKHNFFMQNNFAQFDWLVAELHIVNFGVIPSCGGPKRFS